MSYGAPFCRSIEPFLQNLKGLLDECARMGVSDFAAAVTAQAVYDDISGFVVYVPYGSDCERHTTEVKAAIDRVTALLQATPGASISLLRPDAAPPPEGDASFGIPTWVKYVLIAGVTVYGLSQVVQISKAVPRRRRMAGYRRRSRR